MAQARVERALAVAAQVDDGRQAQGMDLFEVARGRLAVMARAPQHPALDPRAVGAGIAAVVAEVADAFERENAVVHRRRD